MNNKVSFIDKCPLLAGLPDEAREFLAQKAYCQHFSQGDTIYPSGSHLERLSIIAKGQVRICSSNFAGREATLAILDNGAWFGDTVFAQELRGYLEPAPIVIVSLSIYPVNC